MTNRKTEQQTRTQLIDPALRQAGWDLTDTSQVGQEVPLDKMNAVEWDILRQRLQDEGFDPEADLPSGITDYELYQEDGQVLAVVEAKRESKDPRIAELQAQFYVEEIAKRQGQTFVPFIFLTNGQEILFGESGYGSPRKVHGFFTLDDLMRLRTLREMQLPLAGAEINLAITDRDYQIEAVRRICERFEEGHRRALLVMATGTGKTRTAMSLVDVFIQSHQALKILFVTDRDELTKQALNEGFSEHLPDEPCVRIRSKNQAREDTRANRLFSVTLQTLSNCFRDFSPGFFDLIIFDEAHRSIFNKWNDVLGWFDARIIGLTATPAGFIARNTFLQFHCYDGKPTFNYTYIEAVENDPPYLVDFKAPYTARTGFQRKGIKGQSLTEAEQEALREQGKDPDDMDYSGTDLEKRVSNKGTLRSQWQEVMDVCIKDGSGHDPGKTIVFAMNHNHAMRLKEAFDQVYPGRTDLAQVITSQSEYKDTGVKGFKKQDRPRIAISVDMLETGVNVPEVVNLVFMRPINSRIKLTQMVGRGTRTLESCKFPERLPVDPETGAPMKDRFLIIDFWENDFGTQTTKEPPTSQSVIITIFGTRLKLLEHYLQEDPYDQERSEVVNVVALLREQIGTIPVDSLNVKDEYRKHEEVWGDDFWIYLTPDKVTLLRNRVQPLLRFAPGGDLQAASLTSKIERLKLGLAQQKDSGKIATAIAADVDRIPSTVLSTDAERDAQNFGRNVPKLMQATPEELDALRETLGEFMKRRAKRDTFETIDLPDKVVERGYIIITSQDEPVHVEKYRELVQARVDALVQNHPTIQAVQRGDTVADLDLVALERTLREELGRDDLQLNEANIRRAYDELEVDSLLGFLRALLDLKNLPGYRDLVERQFTAYMADHAFTADQTRFLSQVKRVFLDKGALRASDLHRAPFDRFGNDAANRFFKDDELTDLMAFIRELTVENITVNQ